MKIYLAGPDIFRPDAMQHGEWLKRLCSQHGFTGLYPLDGALAADLPAAQAASAICRANLARIDEADLVMANLDPFRGHEPDSGTAFEVGYAHARGKPVWAYIEQAGPLARRLLKQDVDIGTHYVDDNGYTVENFGLALNLMLACSVTVVAGDARTCLEHIAERFPALSAIPVGRD